MHPAGLTCGVGGLQICKNWQELSRIAMVFITAAPPSGGRRIHLPYGPTPPPCLGLSCKVIKVAKLVKLVKIVKLVKLLTLSISNQTKIDPESTQNRPKIDQKSTKIDQKSSLDGAWGPFGPQGGSGSRLDPETLIRWTPWAPQVGSQN